MRAGTQRSIARVVHAGGCHRRTETAAAHPAGTLTGCNSWNPPLGSILRTNLAGRQEAERLDLRCTVKHSRFEVPAEADGQDELLTADREVGFAHVAMRLMARLQSMGTVPALDIDLYTAGLANASS